MKNAILTIILTLTLSTVRAQQAQEYVTITNFQNSIVIDLNQITNTKNSSFNFDDYGNIQYHIGNSSTTPRYLFQAQEHDLFLTLYHFRNRIYSSDKKIFFQPDPASQYDSPYLFVNSDPINLIDLNGKEGKPIVFYQEDASAPGGIPDSMADLMNDIPNAHYFPMRELVEERVGEISDWNGSIFLKGHMSPTKGAEITIESMPKGTKARTRSFLTQKVGTSDTEESVVIDSKQFGRQLRVFAEKNPFTDVKSIVAGGCQGSIAGEGIGKGFTDKDFGKSRGRRFEIQGLKKGRYAAFYGKKMSAEKGVNGFSSTRFYTTSKDEDLKSIVETRPGHRSVLKDYEDTAFKDGRAKPYATTTEIEGFYSGERGASAPFRDISFKKFTY